jgi:hypothetical protein
VLPLEVAKDHGFLAVGMAGRVLPREHGSPARLLVSGRTGQDGNTKWVRRLTVTTDAPLSYWGRRGWIDGDYPVHPSSRIDTPAAHACVPPGDTKISGYAWAPPNGVAAVQLQVDRGPWLDVDLGVDLGPDAWRPWSAHWEATGGSHELRVRCRSNTGEWQRETLTAPYPHGVLGVHAITVHVGGGRLQSAARRLGEKGVARLTWAARSLTAWS